MNIYKMTHKYRGSWRARNKETYIVASESKEDAFKLLGWETVSDTTATLIGTDSPIKKSSVILRGEVWS